MPASARFKTQLLRLFWIWLWIGLCAWVLPSLALANDYAAEVKTVDISVRDNLYVLSADIHYQLSPKALDALQNGVGLFWMIYIKVQHPGYFWDETLTETTLRYRLQYHALLNMYRVRNENNNGVRNFSTLSAALDSISTLRDLPVISTAAVDHKNPVMIGLKVQFDRDALPLPLRPIAYLNRQWYLSSDWTLWPLKK